MQPLGNLQPITPLPQRRAPQPAEPGDVWDPSPEELNEAVVKPWLSPSEAMRAFGTARGEDDARALAILRDVERKGLWGDGETASLQDLAFLRLHMPQGASLEEGARGYAVLFDIEKSQHTDPTPHARRAMIVVGPSLREGESMVEAAEAFVELYRFEVRRDINGSEHTREAWERIDKAILPSQTRMVAVHEYRKNPDTFEKRQQEERTRFEERQAEVARVAEAVSRAPREVDAVERHDEWIVANGVRVPRRR
ncbi:MAG: hypothetical protein FJX76_05735 [Armatimonadetes bacterium]|nr:hypothetical protein [Armatimonadota bacterium]